MSSRYIVPIGVLIAAVLICVGGFLIFNPPQSGSTDMKDNINDNGYIEPMQKIVPEIKIQEGELKRNADLQLKIGNKYEYEFKYTLPLNLTAGVTTGGGENRTHKEEIPNVNMIMSGSMDIIVDRKERYNKSDVFVLKYKSTMKFENIEELMDVMGGIKGSEREEMRKIQMMRMYKEGINTSGETWINEDGKTVKTITKMFGMEIVTEGENAAERQFMMSFEPSVVIQPWMLALNENFEWSRNIAMNTTGFRSTSSEKYKFIDVEEIDTKAGKRKCYKVERESISITSIGMLGRSEAVDTKISEKTILWVDYNSRILIKAETWMENLRIGSIELVDENI